MGTEAERKYAEFEAKVKRTVYLDNLSPEVNEAVIETAFDQYAHVESVQFIPNYTEPKHNSKCALMELKEKKEADTIIDVLSSLPFMMMGMPRPVRVRPAVPEMFSDRPAKSDREIPFDWLDPSHPDFEVAQEHKALVKKHAGERSLLLEKQLKEEEDLSKRQNDNLKSQHEKLVKIEALQKEIEKLSYRYEMKVAEDVGMRQFDW